MENDHPYRSQPDRAFWSRVVARDYNPSQLVDTSVILRSDDRVATAGSCFASNLVPWLRRSGIEYLRSGETHPAFVHLADNLGYDDFSAAYGNVYSARHLLQLIQRALGAFTPNEDRWHFEGRVIDPFRPGLRFPALDDEEFDLLTRQHLEATRDVFGRASLFVFTLGLTEAWVSKIDGAAYPACPGTVAGSFDSDKYEFRNFTVNEVVDDLKQFAVLLRSINPTVRIVLTVSPVPLVATATNQHVLLATTYSKSVLRVAAEEVSKSIEGVFYFPAYEIVTGPQAPGDFYAENRRDVTPSAVDAVMSALFANVIGDSTGDHSYLEASAVVSSSPASRAGDISTLISQAECDEVMMDVEPRP